MLDDRDRRILAMLQENAEMHVAEIADQLSLSPSTMALLDRKKINLPTTIFLLLRTGRHSKDWLDQFHTAVSTIPEIVEVHRLTGNFDYILKLTLPNVEHYDTVYKQLIKRMEMHDMSAYISMETVKLSPSLPTKYI